MRPGHSVGSRRPGPEAANRPGNGGGCPQVDLSASPSVASGDVSPGAADGDAATEVLTSANMPPAWSRSADPGSGLRAKDAGAGLCEGVLGTGPGRMTKR